MFQACRAMRYFPPETRVMTRAIFTKCLYAMLTHQKYVPDRRTGWDLPSPTSPLYNEHSLGVKLVIFKNKIHYSHVFVIYFVFSKSSSFPQILH